jgi:hypothetical protein
MVEVEGELGVAGDEGIEVGGCDGGRCVARGLGLDKLAAGGDAAATGGECSEEKPSSE